MKLGFRYKRALFTFVLLIFSFLVNVFGKQIVTSNKLQGMDVRQGKSIDVSDVLYNTPLPSTNVDNTSVGRVILRLSPLEYNLSTDYTTTVRVKATFYDKQGLILNGGVSVEKDLTVSYNLLETSADVVKSTVIEDILVMPGAYRVKVEIVSPDGQTTLPDFISVVPEIEVERYKRLDVTSVPTLSTSVYSANSNELAISWVGDIDADEYELEYSYVSNYPTSSTANNLTYDFKQNSTRITTGNTSYKIPLIYGKGYIVYRVRYVNKTPDNIYPCNWSSSLDKGLVSTLTSKYEILLENEKLSKMNWQYSATFAEEGKRKDVISYFDGTLRGRQEIATLSTQEAGSSATKNIPIVGETIYDYLGRAVIKTLPVPITDNVLEQNLYFKEKFTKVDANNSYGASNFDLNSATSCFPSAAPMYNNAGAARYYSLNNPDKTEENKYIPDAEGYPFSQVEYEPDNTGRIRRQSGVGANHKLGSGHETRYYYASPTQQELNSMFGNDVGYQSFYQKKIVKDANGQLSISYVDMTGKVIATCLAGEAPNTKTGNTTNYSLLPLKTEDGSQNLSDAKKMTITTKVIKESEPYPHKDNINILKDNNSLVISKPIMVTDLGLYTFDYGLTKEYLDNLKCSDGTTDVDVCMECVYDVSLKLIDECGNVVCSLPKTPVGSLKMLSKSGKPNPLEKYTHSLPCSLNVVGTYTLEKTLTINEASIDYYKEAYTHKATPAIGDIAATVDGPFRKSCTTSIDLIDLEYKENINKDCNASPTPCDACSPNLESYLSYKTLLKNPTLDPSNANYNAILDDFYKREYYKALRECTETCEGADLVASTYQFMLRDVSPNGQYGATDPSSNDWDISVFNPNNILVKNNIAQAGNFRKPYFNTLDLFANEAELIKTGETKAENLTAGDLNHYFDDKRNIVYLPLSIKRVTGVNNPTKFSELELIPDLYHTGADAAKVYNAVKIIRVKENTNGSYTKLAEYTENTFLYNDFDNLNDGEYWVTEPQYIHNLALITGDDWNDEYAKSLVIAHPEYSYYQFLTESNKIFKTQTGGTGYSNKEFEEAIKVYKLSALISTCTLGVKTRGVSKIFTGKLFDENVLSNSQLLIDKILELDPFFSYYKGTSYKSLTYDIAKAKLLNFQNSSQTLPDLIANMNSVSVFHGGQCSAVGNFKLSAYNGVNTQDDEVYQEQEIRWAKFVSFYLGIKNDLILSFADSYSKNKNNYDGGCNACIGNDSYTPPLELVPDYGDYWDRLFGRVRYKLAPSGNIHQPCNSNNYNQYVKKAVRFGIPKEYQFTNQEALCTSSNAIVALSEKANSERYVLTGQYPIEASLELTLNALANEGILHSTGLEAGVTKQSITTNGKTFAKLNIANPLRISQDLFDFVTYGTIKEVDYIDPEACNKTVFWNHSVINNNLTLNASIHSVGPAPSYTIDRKIDVSLTIPSTINATLNLRVPKANASNPLVEEEEFQYVIPLNFDKTQTVLGKKKIGNTTWQDDVNKDFVVKLSKIYNVQWKEDPAKKDEFSADADFTIYTLNTDAQGNVSEKLVLTASTFINGSTLDFTDASKVTLPMDWHYKPGTGGTSLTPGVEVDYTNAEVATPEAKDLIKFLSLVATSGNLVCDNPNVPLNSGLFDGKITSNLASYFPIGANCEYILNVDNTPITTKTQLTKVAGDNAYDPRNPCGKNAFNSYQVIKDNFVYLTIKGTGGSTNYLKLKLTFLEAIALHKVVGFSCLSPYIDATTGKITPNKFNITIKYNEFNVNNNPTSIGTIPGIIEFIDISDEFKITRTLQRKPLNCRTEGNENRELIESFLDESFGSFYANPIGINQGQKTKLNTLKSAFLLQEKVTYTTDNAPSQKANILYINEIDASKKNLKLNLAYNELQTCNLINNNDNLHLLTEINLKIDDSNGNFTFDKIINIHSLVVDENAKDNSSSKTSFNAIAILQLLNSQVSIPISGQITMFLENCKTVCNVGKSELFENGNFNNPTLNSFGFNSEFELLAYNSLPNTGQASFANIAPLGTISGVLDNQKAPFLRKEHTGKYSSMYIIGSDYLAPPTTTTNSNKKIIYKNVKMVKGQKYTFATHNAILNSNFTRRNVGNASYEISYTRSVNHYQFLIYGISITNISNSIPCTIQPELVVDLEFDGQIISQKAVYNPTLNTYAVNINIPSSYEQIIKYTFRLTNLNFSSQIIYSNNSGEQTKALKDTLSGNYFCPQSPESNPRAITNLYVKDNQLAEGVVSPIIQPIKSFTTSYNDGWKKNTLEWIADWPEDVQTKTLEVGMELVSVDNDNINGNVYLATDDISLSTGCNSFRTTIPEPPVTTLSPCEDRKAYLQAVHDINVFNHEKQVISLAGADFTKKYYAKCLGTAEKLAYTYINTQYHYTLYYYDQAGNLTKTIPPQGVSLVTDNKIWDKIDADRAIGAYNLKYQPKHSMATTYRYNSLGQLVTESLPDHKQYDIWQLINPLQESTVSIPTSQTISSIASDNTGSYILANTSSGESNLYTLENKQLSLATKLGNQALADVYYLSSDPSGKTAFAVGNAGKFLKTTNGGATWNEYPTGIEDNLRGVYFSSDDNGFVITDKGEIWHTSEVDPLDELHYEKWVKATLTGISLSSYYVTDLRHLGNAVDQGYSFIISAKNTDIYATTNATESDLFKITYDFATNTWTGTQITKAPNNISYVFRKADLSVEYVEGNIAYSNTSISAVPFTNVAYGYHEKVAITSNGELWYKALPNNPKWTRATGTFIIPSEQTANPLFYTTDGKVFEYDNTAFTLSEKANKKINFGANTLKSVSYLQDDINTPIFTVSDNSIRTASSSENFKLSIIPKESILWKNASNTICGLVKASDDKVYFLKKTNAPQLANTPLASLENTKIQKITWSSTYSIYNNKVAALLTENNSIAVVDIAVLDGSSTTSTIYNSTNSVVAYNIALPIGYTSNDVVRMFFRGTNLLAFFKDGKSYIITVYNTSQTLAQAIAHKTPVLGKTSTLHNNKVYIASQNDILTTYNVVNNNISFEGINVSDFTNASYKDVAVNTTSNEIMAVSSQGAAIKKANGVWENANASATALTNLNSIVVANNKFYVGSSSTATITEIGTSITSFTVGTLTDNPFIDLESNGTEAIAVGNSASIATYNGTTWTNTSKINPLFLNALAVSTDKSISIAVGKQGTIVTKGALATDIWVRQSNKLSDGSFVFKEFIYAAFKNENTAFLVSKDANVYTYNTSDKTLALTAVANSTGLTAIDAAFHSAGNFAILLSNGNVVLYSSSIVTKTVNTNLKAIAFRDEDNLVAVGDDGTIYNITQTSDDVYSIKELKKSASEKWTTQNLRDVVFTNTNIGYAVGDNGTILKTLNGGASWINKTITPATSYDFNKAVIDASGNIFFVDNNANAQLSSLSDQSDKISKRYWYDQLGRIVVSQHAAQYVKTPQAYSYTRYDELGRIIESGQIQTSASIAFNAPVQTVSTNGGASPFDTWLETGICSDITRNYYNQAKFTLPNFKQENLRNRVSSIAYYRGEEKGAATRAELYQTPPAHFHAVHYNYDVHGNVTSYLNDDSLMNAITGHRYKIMEYEFDYIAGKVNKVYYQKGQADQFVHKYYYDSENRIVSVYTSADGYKWDEEASYKYYKHGPLARVELGNNKVQGMDYAYNIQGWIKGVNSSVLNEAYDQGADGLAASKHAMIPKDEMGYTLHYFDNDYKAIGYDAGTPRFDADGIYQINENAKYHHNLYNGNISSMVTSIAEFGKAQTAVEKQPATMLSTYYYDQLNRLVSVDKFTKADIASANSWVGAQRTSRFSERFKYDYNGNITHLQRNGGLTTTADTLIDNLVYNYENINNGYESNTNKLRSVDEVAITGNNRIEQSIKSGQVKNNYVYDQIGNLIADPSEGISNIKWLVTGKIHSITKNNLNIEFGYDIAGNRISKKVTHTSSGDIDYTFYIRDHSGTTMSNYSYSTGSISTDNQLTQTEVPLYGSSRLGIYNPQRVLSNALTENTVVQLTYDASNPNHRLLDANNASTTLTSNEIGFLLKGQTYTGAITLNNGSKLVNNGELVSTSIAANTNTTIYNYNQADLTSISLLASASLYNYGECTISSAFTTSQAGVSVYNYGTLTSNNTISLTTGQSIYNYNILNVQSDLSLATGASFSNAGKVTLANNLTLAQGASLSNTKLINVNGGNCTINGAYQAIGSANAYLRVGGTLSFTATATLTGNHFITSPNTIVQASGFTLPATANISASLAYLNFASNNSLSNYKRSLGGKQFELSNHLGNVLATISDQKTAILTGTTITGFNAITINANDYYAFGSLSRNINNGAYRYGFNGQENDDEFNEGSYDFGARMLDARLGRWLAIDQLYAKYPSVSPYNFTDNNPIKNIEIDGNYWFDVNVAIVLLDNNTKPRFAKVDNWDVFYVNNVNELAQFEQYKKLTKESIDNLYYISHGYNTGGAIAVAGNYVEKNQKPQNHNSSMITINPTSNEQYSKELEVLKDLFSKLNNNSTILFAACNAAIVPEFNTFIFNLIDQNSTAINFSLILNKDYSMLPLDKNLNFKPKFNSPITKYVENGENNNEGQVLMTKEGDKINNYNIKNTKFSSNNLYDESQVYYEIIY